MRWVKKLWFPASAIILAGIIGFNLWQVASVRWSNRLPTDQAGTANTQRNRANTGAVQTPADEQAAAKKKAVPVDLVSSTGPQQIVLAIQPKNGDADIEGEALTSSLKELGPVEDAVVEGNTVKITITESLNLSDLVKRLGVQQTVAIEDQFPLQGGLRLHAAGMTWQGCASALKEELSSLEGVEVKGIDLRSVKEGYVYLSVPDKSSLTLAKLKQAVKKTPFDFVDVQWVVRKPQDASK